MVSDNGLPMLTIFLSGFISRHTATYGHMLLRDLGIIWFVVIGVCVKYKYSYTTVHSTVTSIHLLRFMHALFVAAFLHLFIVSLCRYCFFLCACC